MLISRIGEFGLIERIKRRIKTSSSVIKGIGDDCAVLKFDKRGYQLFTCDMIVEGVDFKTGENPYLVGRKALAVSISDIAACAGTPQHCLVSMGLPKKTSLDFIDRLLQGIISTADKYKINIVGGDLSRQERLTIDVSLLGYVEKKHLVLRSGAKKGDIIFVTGSLGGSIKGKHLKFTPRVKEARYLVRNFKINSMIDISDGFLQDLGHILEESRVGAIIYEDLIPVSKDARNLQDALKSGEDFELLFSLPQKEAKKLLRIQLTGFKPVGRITEEKNALRLIGKDGREKLVRSRGYRHF